MNNGKKLLLLFALLALTSFVMAQEDHHHAEGHQHVHEGDQHDHTNEISIAIGVVPIPSEDEIGLGLHIHYVRGLGDKKIIGLGGSLEAIIESHKHVTFGMVFHVRIYKGLVFAYSPGMLLLIEDTGKEIQFSQHLELAYEFEIKKFHLGPLFELGIEKEGLHFMAGLHFGIDF